MKTWALRRRRFASVVLSGVLACLGTGPVSAAKTPLADQPVRVADVPANVMLALSVEFPTAITRAYKGTDDTFQGSKKYLGYFDPEKCYQYVSDAVKGNYFKPADFTTAAALYSCAGKNGRWSGNFMNWATMQGIDTFRWALTGGLRSYDEPKTFDQAPGVAPYGATILERAYASKQGSYLTSNFIDRSLGSTDLAKYTDTAATGVTTGTLGIRNGGEGVQVRFGLLSSSKWPDGSNGTSGAALNVEDNNACTKNTKYPCKMFDVRVEVCRDEKVNGVSLLEINCQKYVSGDGSKTVWKPVGLIQKYRDKMYFGAFGYLGLFTATDKDANGVTNPNKDGGVLRAKLQSIASEILPTGAFPDDPYGTGADQGVKYSGTINYLNRFGQDKGLYKYYDPVSELYAEVVKYFKALTPTPSYISGLNTQLRDNFPVFETWNDPAVDAKYPSAGPLSCKKNYIVGIGDTHSQYDLKNLSGASAPASGVDADMGSLKTAVEWTNAVGVLEGLGGNLGVTAQGGGTDNGYLIAGIAYYAHSSDIRTDLAGTQNISTYWMDVLEPSIPKLLNDQYWLATKYGGYTKPDGSIGLFDAAKDSWYEKTAAGAPARTYTDTGNNKTAVTLPTNYYPASSPDAMVAGLQSAFKSIASGSGTGAGSALSSPQLNVAAGGGNSYQGTYDASTWKGDVTASAITSFDNNNQPVTSTLWSAATKLGALAAGSGWDSARKIATLALKDESKAVSASNLKAVPFRFASLGATQKLNLSKTSVTPSGDDVDGQRVLNYLRGDRTYESTASVTNLYRQRESLLGDIVDSQVVYVGAPGEGYGDAYNPGYSQFVTSKANRTPVVYVGANDGMLHAFDASNTSNAGNELFAVVPYSLYAGPDDVPETSGIQALARPTYAHRYYMNATPEVRSIDFARAGGTVAGDQGSFDWRTLLVVGEGKGGRSYIGVDVTSISSSMTEVDAASKVLWEFSDPDMGFSFGQPLIVKTAKWGWVVLLTGGYNNTTGPNAGKGVLYVVNPTNGALLQAVYTTEGTAAEPSGLAQIAGFTSNYQDYTVDYVYGGDLNGSVWRFDFTSKTNAVPDPTKIASLKAPDGTAQAVTAIPRVEYSADDLKRYVFVGTGRLLASEDQGNSQVQTVYAIRDGTRSTAYGDESYQMSFPAGGSFPATRSAMNKVTNLIEGAKLDASAPMGWYYDLTGVSGSVHERIIVGLQTFDGVLSWTGSLLNNDPCNVTGTSRTYSVSYGTGQSVLYTTVGGVGSPVQYLEGSDGLTGMQLVRLGNRIVIVGTTAQGKLVVFEQTVAEAGDPRVVNWRIIRE
ncbi:pilus assembly protein [Zoogloea sp.]|uniref:pilus assembly protein n=1 Tax=Zoogloea sp. TaxID=49181 RepID=UPI0035ADD077